MIGVDKMIPILKKSAEELVRLTENPEIDNQNWFIEIGVHLHTISAIYGGIDPTKFEKKSYFRTLLKKLKR
jgi:hypothetical protein